MQKQVQPSKIENMNIKRDKHSRIQHRISSLIPDDANDNCDYFIKEVLPELRNIYTVNILHRTTMQTRIVNEANGKKIDYYPFYRKVNDFKYKKWSILSTDEEILGFIKNLLI